MLHLKAAGCRVVFWRRCKRRQHQTLHDNNIRKHSKVIFVVFFGLRSFGLSPKNKSRALSVLLHLNWSSHGQSQKEEDRRRSSQGRSRINLRHSLTFVPRLTSQKREYLQILDAYKTWGISRWLILKPLCPPPDVPSMQVRSRLIF